MIYRVWDNEEKKMHYDYDAYNPYPTSRLQSSFFMMASGIKDIFGKDIYELDILVQSDYDYDHKGDSKHYYVVFKKGCFWITSSGKCGIPAVFEQPLFIYAADKFKVIGNLPEQSVGPRLES